MRLQRFERLAILGHVGGPPDQHLRTARVQGARIEEAQRDRGKVIEHPRQRVVAESIALLAAERAGVSVGSLYQYFPNKDSLIAALHARQMNEIVERELKRSEGLAFDEALHSVIAGLVDAHHLEAGLHRVLETQLAGLDTLDDHAEVEARISAQIRTLLLRYPREIHVPNLDLAEYALMHAVHALVHAIMYERPPRVSLPAATAEIVRLARVYLTAPAPNP